MPVLASFAVVMGLKLLPLAEVTALTFASPLVVVALAGPLLRERSSIHDWIGVIVGFIGILVIVRPGGDAVAWAASSRSPARSVSRCSSWPPASSAATTSRRRRWPGPSPSGWW